MIDKTKLVGMFTVEHRDKNGCLIGIYKALNAVVTVGADDILDVEFFGGTQSPAWYIGLVNNSGWTAFSAADTLSVHGGWTEAAGGGTIYTGNRPQWTVGAASGRSNTNAATVDFAIVGSATLKGIFICNVNTGTAGILWSEAAFSSLVTVNGGDTLKVTYTLSIP